MQIAAQRGNLAVMQALLDGGADVNVTGANRKTLCHYAAMNRLQAPVMAFVASQGVDVNARDGEGQTACHIAILAQSIGAVRILLDAGTDVNATDVRGATLCHWAARARDASILELLIERGADIRAKDNAGGTLCYHASAELLPMLFERGFDLLNAAPEPTLDKLLTMVAVGFCGSESESESETEQHEHSEAEIAWRQWTLMKAGAGGRCVWRWRVDSGRRW